MLDGYAEKIKDVNDCDRPWRRECEKRDNKKRSGSKWTQVNRSEEKRAGVDGSRRRWKEVASNEVLGLSFQPTHLPLLRVEAFQQLHQTRVFL